jgi:hypothetical protein
MTYHVAANLELRRLSAISLIPMLCLESVGAAYITG